LKVNQAVLDPLGLPLSTPVVSGERAEDPLYVQNERTMSIKKCCIYLYALFRV
jgi:hypothetical protein